MANITQDIANIRKAVYGKEVRESIASAIEQCYTDASEKGNANMEVSRARGTYDNLDERLNENDTRVSKKADKSYVDTKVNSIASGAPTPVNNISEMTDTTKTYLLTTDGYWYYHNGTTWVQGGVYQATEVQDESITSYKINASAYSNYNNRDIQNVSFKIGSYNENTLQYTNNNTRIVTDDYITLNENKCILFNDDTIYASIFSFDENNNLLKFSDWEKYPKGLFLTANNYINNTLRKKVIIALKFGDERVITSTKDILKYITVFTVGQNEEVNPVWENGSFVDSAKRETTVFDEYHYARKRTKMIKLYDNDRIIIDKSKYPDYKFAVYLFDSNKNMTRIGDSENDTPEYYLINDSLVRIMFKKADNSIIKDMTSEEINNIIKIYRFNKNEENLKKESLNKSELNITANDFECYNNQDILYWYNGSFFDEDGSETTELTDNYYKRRRTGFIRLNKDDKISLKDSNYKFGVYEYNDDYTLSRAGNSSSDSNGYTMQNDSLVRIIFKKSDESVIKDMTSEEINNIINIKHYSKLYSNLKQSLNDDLNINNNVLNTSNILVMAHRGRMDIAPENTISSIKKAKETGFNAVEFDLAYTSDNVIVLLHDWTIDNTSNGTGDIRQMTYANAKTYDYGSWFNSSFSNEQIPTLEEALKYCHRNNMYCELDLKDGQLSNHIEQIVTIVKKCGMSKNVCYSGSVLSDLEKILTLDKNACVCLTLCYTNEQIAKLDILLSKANVIQTVVASVNSQYLTETLANTLLQKGAEIKAWTIDNPQDAIKFANMGANRFITTNLNIIDSISN
ncbi:MAG: hypothetical protein MR346_01305 [Clostridium sp.]|nr:hypothetical protein [Clostridium sp.]